MKTKLNDIKSTALILSVFFLQTESQGHLIQIQPDFKGDLIEKVQVFIVDVSSFSSDYHTVC